MDFPHFHSMVLAIGRQEGLKHPHTLKFRALAGKQRGGELVGKVDNRTEVHLKTSEPAHLKCVYTLTLI